MRRPLPPSILLGVLIGVLIGLAVLGALATPLFGIARAVDPGRALDRPFVRTALVGVVLPVSTAAGLAGGVVAGRWYYRRGGG